MGLFYNIIQPVAVFGTKSSAFVLSPSTLTADYADNRKVIAGTAGMSKLDIRYSYTTGASETNNTLSIKIEESSDRTNWFSLMNESASAGTSTLTQRTFSDADNTATATFTSSFGLDIFYDNIRISVKEGGVATNFGTLYMEASILGR